MRVGSPSANKRSQHAPVLRTVAALRDSRPGERPALQEREGRVRVTVPEHLLVGGRLRPRNVTRQTLGSRHRMKAAVLRQTTVLWVTRIFCRPIYSFFSLISDKSHWHGIRIENIPDGITQEDRDLVVGALELIQQVTPWHVESLRRSVRAIVIATGADTGFALLMRLAVANVEDLRRGSREAVAAELVRMAVLARLSRYGWWKHQRLRPRMLRLGLEHTLDFARRLPDPAELVESLTGEFQSSAWQTTSMGDTVAEFFEREKAPRWLVTLTRSWGRLLDS